VINPSFRLYWLGIYERYVTPRNRKWWIPWVFEVDYLVLLGKRLKGFYHWVTSSEGGGSPLLSACIHLLSTVTAGRGLRLPDD
jgi:hypothetical protein